MPYVITSACKDRKDGSCINVCPVDAIHSDDTQFYIDPIACIDCQACATVCPVDAIYLEQYVPKSEKEYIQINADFFVNRK